MKSRSPGAALFFGAAKIVLIIIGILFLGVGALYVVARVKFGPPIHAVDNDPYLTSVAKSAQPLVQTLDQYLGEHHHYPVEREDVETALGPPQTMRQRFGGWNYVADSGDRYDLYFELNWDAGLFYHCRGHQSRWEYDPGDGTATKTIKLNP